MSAIQNHTDFLTTLGREFQHTLDALSTIDNMLHGEELDQSARGLLHGQVIAVGLILEESKGFVKEILGREIMVVAQENVDKQMSDLSKGVTFGEEPTAEECANCPSKDVCTVKP